MSQAGPGTLSGSFVRAIGKDVFLFLGFLQDDRSLKLLVAIVSLHGEVCLRMNSVQSR